LLNLFDLARKLHKLGLAPEFPTVDQTFLAWVLKDMGTELITRYQELHHLPITGKPSAEVVAHAQLPRCGHPDRMADSAESRWAVDALKYFQQIVYPGVDPAEVAADYAAAIASMAAVCGIQITAAVDPGAAQVLALSGPIDGEWNILALTELPTPDAQAGLVLHQTFDIAEVGLTKEQRIAMMAHECGHFLGLGHALPGTGALMEPILGSITTPQAWDTDQLQQRYGAPAASPTGQPPATPASPVPPTTAPASPAPPTQAGPAVSSVVVMVPQAGSFQYNFAFDTPGSYLILIVPLKE
jgi:hypothetical protein